MTLDFSNALTIMVAISFLVISFGLCFFAVRSALSEGKHIKRRLAHSLGDDENFNGAGSAQAGSANFLSKMGAHLTLPDAKEITVIRYRLAQAGYYQEMSVQSFMAARLLSLFVPQILFFIFWNPISQAIGLGAATLLAMTVALAGLMVPNWFIGYKIKIRTQECRRGFPDMMDLMVACVEAGLGLDATLVRVSHELGERYPALKVNLDIMNLELRAGRERHDAMMNFAKRLNVDEASALAIMLKQAEEMGSSIGKALRTFSEEMRHKRMMLAEEKAMALSAKLTVPLILFIFPTIMTMLLMPAAIRISGGLNGGF